MMFPRFSFENVEELNCYNSEVEISVQTNPNADDYVWTATAGGFIENGQGTSSIIVSEAGTYEVVVLHPVSGCESEQELSVTADFALPILEYIVNDTLDCLHPVVTLSAFPVDNDNYSYIWATSLGGNIVDGNNSPSVLVDQPGEYTVLVTNESNGCTSVAFTEVVEDELFNIDLSTIAFPNVFTPDGNDKNAGWRPFLREDPTFDLTQVFNSYSLKIFNRWGSLVFESSNSERTWSDRQSETGVYYYTIEYESLCGSGVKSESSGYIHLMK
jgi:gliding motility-associated-like protein